MARRSSINTSDEILEKPRRSRKSSRGGEFFTLSKISPLNSRQKQMMIALYNNNGSLQFNWDKSIKFDVGLS